MMPTSIIAIVTLLLSFNQSANAASVNPAFVISSDRTTGKFCAGSLIHPDIVLTAATCRGVFAKGAFVGGSQLDGSDGQYHEVELEAIHPKFVEGLAENNVMLLKLKSPSDAVVQEINAETQLPIDGTEIEVLGFNRESAQSIYPFEQTNVVATKLDYATCTAKYAGYNLYIVDSHVFCTSTLGSACHGNMGSPMVDSQGRQVGLVAGGGGCDSKNFPVLNVRTSTFGIFMYQGVCALSSEPFDSCPPRPAPVIQPSISLEPSAAPSTDNDALNLTASETAYTPTAQPSLRGSQQDTPTATPSREYSAKATDAPTMSPSELGYLAKAMSDIEEIKNKTTFDTPSVTPSAVPNNDFADYMDAMTSSPSLESKTPSNGTLVSPSVSPTPTISMNDTDVMSLSTTGNHDTETIGDAGESNETSIDLESTSNVSEVGDASHDDETDLSVNATATHLNLTEAGQSPQDTSDSLVYQNSSIPSQVSPSNLINAVNDEAVIVGAIENALSSNETVEELTGQGNSTDAKYALDDVVNATLDDSDDVIGMNSTESSSNATSDEYTQVDSVDLAGEDKPHNETVYDTAENNETTTLVESDQTESPSSNMASTESSSGNDFLWDDHETASPSVSPAPTVVVTSSESFSPSTSPESSQSLHPSGPPIDTASSIPTVPSADTSVTGTPDASGTEKPTSTDGVALDPLKPSSSPIDSLSGKPTALRGGDDRSAPTVAQAGDPTAPPSLASPETSIPPTKPPTLIGGASSLISNLLHHAKSSKASETPSTSPSANETLAPTVISTGGSASTAETLVPTVAPSDFSNSTTPSADIAETLGGFWNSIKTKFDEKCPVTDDCEFQGFSGSTYHAIAFGQCLQFCGVGQKAQVLGWQCGACPIVEQGTP